MARKKIRKLDTSLFAAGKKWLNREYTSAKEWMRDQFEFISQGEVKEKKWGRIAGITSAANLPPIGRMCYFVYKAEGDGILDYWDRLPLVIMISEDKEHYMGLNLHYLPPKFRALLLGRLASLLNNTKFDKTTYLKASYTLLKSAAKYRYFKPCLKSYLKKNIKSKMLFIDPENWYKAILIPMARFKGASQKRIWAESIRYARK